MSGFWQKNNSRCQAIAASAGSGKTYRLTHRVIGLLANGVDPERVAALTFSRKAAGEILDDVMNYLCQGAGSDDEAARHAADAFASADRAAFLGMLRQMVDALPRLRVQTLDSFTVGTVRAFPFELGISGQFQILDENAAVLNLLREQVLHSIVRTESGAASAFGRDFRQATAADETKSIRQVIEQLVSGYHWAYIDLPFEERWGQPGPIWHTDTIPYGPVADAAGIGRRLADQITGADLPGGDKLAELATGLGRHGYGSTTEFKGRMGEQILSAAPRILAGEEVALQYGGKTFRLREPLVGGFAKLLRHALFFELKLAMDRTGGLFRLVAAYEAAYDRVVRRRGRLTFTDAQLLLAGRDAGEKPVALDLDYRLDARLDHWLLDEFQDTSNLQWEVIRSLIEEILQDPEGRRSFFYVGDIKQAIYQWRNGNPRLFGEIKDRWSVIHESKLPICRRQPRSVIDTVNRVFGSLPEGDITEGNAIPESALAEWNREWVEHQVPPGTGIGYTALLNAPPVGQKAAGDDTFPIVAAIVNQVEPTARGLTTGILVRGNATGKKLSDFLRQACPRINIVMEGRRPLTDSMAVAVILSLLKVAAHPGDGMARGHLRLSPLWPYLQNAGLDNRSTLSLHVLEHVHSRGFQDSISTWARALSSSLGKAAVFDRLRLSELSTAAARFDALGDKDIDQFLNFIEGYQARETAQESAVRIMTVHQAKGLGFDLVILPELTGTRSFTRCYDPGFVSDGFNWLLKAPKRDLASIDPTICAAFRRADSEACFENLCVLYVAMTRARRAMYMITSESGGKTVNYKRLLETQLGQGETACVELAGLRADTAYRHGDPDWYGRSEADDASPGQEGSYVRLERDVLERHSRRRRLAQLTPSETGVGETAVSSIFSSARRLSLAVGTGVHEVMASIAWLEESDPRQVLNRWSKLKPSALSDGVTAHIAAAFQSGAVRRLFSKPSGSVSLWREKPFEAIVDGGWVSGVFDRVSISHARGGEIEATIIDFKTDAVSGVPLEQLVDRHRAQLELYRKVLAGILRLRRAAIACKFVFTANGTVVDLP